MADHRHRALRLSKGVPSGERIFSYLTSAPVRNAMIRAACESRVPLSDLSPELVGRFPDAFASLRARQLAGLTVRAVLAEEGFEVDRQQVRLVDDPIFKVAASYRRAPSVSAPPGGEWIGRVVGMMSKDEARYAKALLDDRLQGAGIHQ